MCLCIYILFFFPDQMVRREGILQLLIQPRVVEKLLQTAAILKHRPQNLVASSLANPVKGVFRKLLDVTLSARGVLSVAN